MFSPEAYRALTETAIAVQRGDRGVLLVTGADRLTWLQGLLTNDVVALPVGGVCDAAYLTAQGRMISDMRVINQETRTLLDVPAPLAASLHQRLDALLFSEDAQVRDASAELVNVDLHGVRAVDIIGEESTVRHDVFEVSGFTAFVPAADVAALMKRLVDRGAIETTLETLDVIRIEAGRPAFLIDMDEQTIPLEAGLERNAISYTKGCYVGQEVIVRVTHRGGGRVAKRLVGFRINGQELPNAGTRVMLGSREIGRITSATRSPTLGAVIGLGYVHRGFVEPGTRVELETSAGRITAEVSSPPFVPLALRLQSSGV